MKKKVNVTDPTALIPELPQPEDLKPFPTHLSMEFKFHTTCVKSISISPCGLYLASGDEDGNLVIWHIQTTRIMRKYKLDNKAVDCVEWCPSKERCILSAVNEEFVYLINPCLYSSETNEATIKLLEETEKNYKIEVGVNDKKEQFLKWQFKEDSRGMKMIQIKFDKVIRSVVWHSKGDYFSTMAHNIQSSNQVMIHSLAKASS
jgi:ribosome biogenesis protein ERB1